MRTTCFFGWAGRHAGHGRRRPLPRSLPRGALADEETEAGQRSGSAVVCRPMDIDEFYEADPRRRASAELELGSEWLDVDGVRTS